MKEVIIFQVRIPKNRVKDICDYLDRLGVGYQSTGEVRFTNLDNWLHKKGD